MAPNIMANSSPGTIDELRFRVRARVIWDVCRGPLLPLFSRGLSVASHLRTAWASAEEVLRSRLGVFREGKDDLEGGVDSIDGGTVALEEGDVEAGRRIAGRPKPGVMSSRVGCRDGV